MREDRQEASITIRVAHEEAIVTRRKLLTFAVWLAAPAAIASSVLAPTPAVALFGISLGGFGNRFRGGYRGGWRHRSRGGGHHGTHHQDSDGEGRSASKPEAPKFIR